MRARHPSGAARTAHVGFPSSAALAVQRRGVLAGLVVITSSGDVEHRDRRNDKEQPRRDQRGGEHTITSAIAIAIAIAPVAAEIMPDLPPVKSMITAMLNEAYRPTLGSTPAMMEEAMASGMSASATSRAFSVLDAMTVGEDAGPD
jgi:hypothetical protein